MTIQPASDCHIPSLAKIHSSSLSEDFLPSLGLDFLEAVYYPAALNSTHAQTLVVMVDDQPVGFVTIAHDSDQFTRDVVTIYLFVIARYAVRAIFQDWRNISKQIEVFWSALLSKPDPIKSEIVFIAVDERYRGQGYGKQLVRSALTYLHQRNITSCRTKTLAKNTNVIGMYTQIGWHIREHFRLIGNEYVTLVTGT